MKKGNSSLLAFLRDLLRRRKKLPSQIATDIGVSHATMSRWLSGKDIPSTASCRKLAEYAGVPVQQMLAIVGYVPKLEELSSSEWPEFRQYAQMKYPAELDEDLVTMIEDLIERRRSRKKETGAR